MGAMKKALCSSSDAFQMTMPVPHSGADLEQHSIRFREELPQFLGPPFALVYGLTCHLPQFLQFYFAPFAILPFSGFQPNDDFILTLTFSRAALLSFQPIGSLCLGRPFGFST
jgi:hypothetical protein